MEWFFTSHRKFSWQGCLVCGLLALFLAAVVVYGGVAIADATSETRAGEQALIQDSFAQWNDTLPAFQEVNFTVHTLGMPAIPLLRNESIDYVIPGWPLESYPHFKYFAQVSFFDDLSVLTTVTANGLVPGTQLAEYNLTTNVSIEVSPHSDLEAYSLELTGVVVLRRSLARLNQKSNSSSVCGMHNAGVYDLATQACYQYYALSSLCTVYNLTSRQFEGGCRGTYEDWVRLHWGEMSLPNNVTVESGITVRADTDPYLVDARLKVVSTTHVEKVIVGALLIVIGCLFFLIPIIYFWQVVRNKSENLLQKRTFEMAKPREGYIPRY